ncbi:hypothetical protein [Desulfocicer niacini]
MGEASKKDLKAFLFEDPQNKDYALGLIVCSEDLESEWAKTAMTILRTDKYREKFQDHFQSPLMSFWW